MSEKSIAELKADKAELQKRIKSLLFDFEKKYQTQISALDLYQAAHSATPTFESVSSVKIVIKI